MPIHHGRCGPRGRAAGARWLGEAARPTQATLLARSPGAASGLGGFRACAGPFSSGRRSRARPGEARAQGATVSRHRPRRPGLRVPRLPAPLPGRVLRPLSTPSSNPHIARGRSERAATKEAGKRPRRGSSLSGAEGGARPALSAPRAPARWAPSRSSCLSPAACGGRPASWATRGSARGGGRMAGAQQRHVAAPDPGLAAPGRSAQGPGVPSPAWPRAPRRMIFGKKVLMANLVFILKLLTMIFLG